MSSVGQTLLTKRPSLNLSFPTLGKNTATWSSMQFATTWAQVTMQYQLSGRFASTKKPVPTLEVCFGVRSGREKSISEP